MNRFLFILCTVLMLGSCTTTEQEREVEAPEQDTTATVILYDSTGIAVDSVIVPRQRTTFEVKLDCRLISPADADNPLFEVALITFSKRVPLDTIHACNNFTEEDFAAIEIPSRAISACGGWYQGVGEYFYLTEDNADLVVSYAWLKEEQTTNRYPYREVYRLKLPELEQ